MYLHWHMTISKPKTNTNPVSRIPSDKPQIIMQVEVIYWIDQTNNWTLKLQHKNIPHTRSPHLMSLNHNPTTIK